MWRIIRQIPRDPRIIIEAGTPYCKLEGMEGVRLIRRFWRGMIVADLKTTDGAIAEVAFAYRAGANAVTAAGSAPVETLDFFTQICQRYQIYSMIDMLGVDNPLRKVMRLKTKPDFVVIHKGRDEESNPRSIIRYKDINKVRSKFDVFISVAGGLKPDNVRTAYFNGADVAILNIIRSGEPNAGIYENANFRILIPKLLDEIGK